MSFADCKPDPLPELTPALTPHTGLANGGLLRFASDSTSNNSFTTAIDAAAGLIQVAVGLTVGLYLAAASMNLVSRRGRGRGAHLSTF